MTKKLRVINIIIWSILSAIWIGLTVSKIVSHGALWEILMNGFVAALSATNLIIHIVFLIKKK